MKDTTNTIGAGTSNVPAVNSPVGGILNTASDPVGFAAGKPDVKSGAFAGTELIPSNWSIKAADDGIEATHVITGKFFKGTIAEFNKNLKG